MRLQLPDGTIHDAGTEPKTAASLLAGFGINPLEVIVTRNGKLIPEDAIISESDEIKVFLVAHGG
jgi:sulfur carrier protein